MNREDPDDPLPADRDDSDASASMADDSPGALEQVDGRIVDLLAWILDTETRAKIYVYLLANPGSTSEEIATGTGLYPSTVREALAELNDEGKVDREKRASDGAGNNPYEYTTIAPSELVGGVVDQVQRELNTIFTLDRILDRGEPDFADDDAEPVTITVDDEVATPTDATESRETDADDAEDADDTDDADDADEAANTGESVPPTDLDGVGRSARNRPAGPDESV